MKITPRQCRWFRMKRSGLWDPFGDPLTAAGRLMGVQAQILPAAGLALYNRVEGPFDHDDFEAMLFEERSLLKLWGQRSTLHLYPSEDWPLLAGAVADKRSWMERVFTKKGGDPKEFRAHVDAVAALMREEGTLSRSQLRESELELPDYLLSSWGGLFHELVRRGEACHAARTAGEGLFAHRSYWLPELAWEPASVDESNVEIALRYFRCYGPSTLKDLAYWRGARIRDAKRWMEAFAEQLVEVEAYGQQMLVLDEDLEELCSQPPSRDRWPLRMLYRFDPLLLAHKDKSWLVPMKHYPQVWRKAGHIEGTILQFGQITGTWRYQRSGKYFSIQIYPFAEYPEEIEDVIVEEAIRVADFFGRELEEVEFAL